MINQELLRTTALTIEMKNMRKKINSKAVFNQRDIRTAMLLCQLTMDGESIDLTDCTISAEILKPDGKTVIQKGQVVDAISGTVAIGLTEQCLSSIGDVSCEIIVQYGNQILYSPKISYIVVDNLFDTTQIESTDELPILNVLIAEVQNIQSNMVLLETTLTANEEGRKNEFLGMKEEIRSFIDTNNVKIFEIENKINEINNTLTSILEKIEISQDETSDLGGL